MQQTIAEEVRSKSADARALRLSSMSFVFPMFNEAGNIHRLISDALEAGRQLADDFEIVIVNDASTDGCGQIADQLATQHPQLRVIHHAVNQKLGGSLRTGFKAARKEWVFYTDSDLPIRLLDATAALPLAQSADVIIGYRMGRNDGLKRHVMSFVYNRMIRLAFGLKVRDVNFAFKLFRRSIVDHVTLNSRGCFIDAEFLIEARKNGAKIAEVGMVYQARIAGESTLASTGSVMSVLKDMRAYRRSAWSRPSAAGAMQ